MAPKQLPQPPRTPLMSYRAETILTVVASIVIVLATIAILAFGMPHLGH